MAKQHMPTPALRAALAQALASAPAGPQPGMQPGPQPGMPPQAQPGMMSTPPGLGAPPAAAAVSSGQPMIPPQRRK